MKATAKADIVKAMADSFDYGTKVINEFNNTTIQDTVQAPFMGPSTRARVCSSSTPHTQDIYGQMAVYLRPERRRCRRRVSGRRRPFATKTRRHEDSLHEDSLFERDFVTSCLRDERNRNQLE